MATSIPETLAGVAWLNRPGQPFGYYVEGASIIGRWLCEDQTLWPPHTVTRERLEFLFIVELGQDGTYKERTREAESNVGVQRSGSGGLGLSMGKSTFAGNSARKSFSAELGRDASGRPTIQTDVMDTTMMKQPLRDYLAHHGWKPKGGLMSKLFG